MARLKSNRSTTTASTLINTSPRSSAGSGSGTGTTSGTASGSGLAQTFTTLSTQIQKLKNAATAPRILGGGTIIRTTNYGSLITDDGTDNRCRLAHLRELYDQKLNVSTSFDPSSLSCSNCSSGPHQIIPLSGKGHSSPACFILSDQKFRVEDATLADLVSTFLMLTKGCDIGIGSVIVLSSLNHLGRVGIAAYSEDLVAALQSIRTTFGGQVQALNGYPFPTMTITDKVTIRALMEMEAWLDMADNRRAHSMEVTSIVQQALCQTHSPYGRRSRIQLYLKCGDPPLHVGLHIQQREVGFCWPGVAKTSHFP